MNKNPLYQFTGIDGGFRVSDADRQGVLYFPLVNEQGCMSSISPDLGGDIKLDQHSFFNLPVSYEDLQLSRSSRNFWLSIKGKGGKDTLWSVSGRSVWQRADGKNEDVELQAGLLWHEVTRVNKKLGISAKVLSFVPALGGKFEVMRIEITNVSAKPVQFTATSAIPFFGRSADNLRDHRHVTSLLHRTKKEKYGVSLSPTMSFNERGHLINHTAYYVIGADDKGQAPVGLFATEAAFIGEGGDLERPLSLLEGRPVPLKVTEADQGKEAIGALQFRPRTLKKGQTAYFVLFLGIDKDAGQDMRKAESQLTDEATRRMLEETKHFWQKKISSIEFKSGDTSFNHWVRWVQTQPVFRKLYGCSFLPDFDYGRGGRGWRDLWQDCLALILADPMDVREDIVRNFGGVRIDGSNATIIGRVEVKGKWVPEFIADRNNIARTWMDHGVWPFLTTLLYLNQTGDWELLRETAPYFRDALIHRGKKFDASWTPDSDPDKRTKLKNRSGEVYQGTIFEHFLVQTLVQFFNVGEHNMIRLEDADWNDGLDMAHDRGESVAFTSMYGGNLKLMAELLEQLASKAGWTEVSVAEEVMLLIDRVRSRVDYDSVTEKRKRLMEYFETVAKGVKGTQSVISISQMIRDLKEKSDWIKRRVNEQEWIASKQDSWYNGYYDNQGRRVEGIGADGRVRMTLSGQVYPVMAGVASDEQVLDVIKSVRKFLFDEKLGGVRLNTDFGGLQPDLGRAFSFAYGEKENGAVFSHMAVMYSSALYQRGFAAEGHRVLSSLFNMAKDSARSRIYPGLPEYFNNEARGRYMYLTGSASWYVLTLLTQSFGTRGLGGDLLIAPKLEPDQFDKKGEASVSFWFAGARVTVVYSNPKKLPYEKARIENVKADKGDAPFTRLSESQVLIQRQALARRKDWKIQVQIGEKK